jgi:aspartate/methionine/tyrosine aminotransferase
VKIIPVTFAEENVLNENCIQDLKSALARAECKVKGVVLCNPHNPLGRCYTKKALEAISSFCETHDLHLISDEIYALSTYSSHDIPHTVQFVSMLSLDLSALKVDPTRVHVIWSVSKDFGCSGLRLVSPALFQPSHKS